MQAEFISLRSWALAAGVNTLIRLPVHTASNHSQQSLRMERPSTAEIFGIDEEDSLTRCEQENVAYGIYLTFPGLF